MNSALSWTYQGPYRTLGMRAFNLVCGVLRQRGWKRPLDTQRLMGVASRRTRLDDWGDESFREPLDRLVTAFETEARLTPLGRLMLRGEFIRQLSNRLRIQHAIREQPGVLNSPVLRPLFVVGLPRTGTTLLLNLLAQEPRRRPLLTHEVLFPLGCRSMLGRHSDGRQKTRWAARLVDSVAPDLKAVHPLKADVPEECTWLLANTFVSPYFLLYGRIPSYLDYLLGLDFEQRVRAYRYYRLQLQLLQQYHVARSWVLKSPAHLSALDSLLEVFPDACVVQTHRDPRRSRSVDLQPVCGRTRNLF